MGGHQHHSPARTAALSVLLMSFAATTATAVPAGGGTAAWARAASARTFKGRTAQKLAVSFQLSGSSVKALKTNLSVICISSYPASKSEIELLAIAPKAAAAVRRGSFTVKLPTRSRGKYTTLTGTISGGTAHGTIKSSFAKSWLVYNPSTGFSELAIASCAGSTTWKASAG